MKKTFFIILGIFLVFVYGQGPSKHEKCANENEITDDIMMEILYSGKTLDTENEKCFLSCFYRELEIVSDNNSRFSQIYDIKFHRCMKMEQ